VDINARDGIGQTAIFYAPSVEVLNFLLDRGADPTLLDDLGCSLLMKLNCSWDSACMARLLQDPRSTNEVTIM
jgi:hypothetical protein